MHVNALRTWGIAVSAALMAAALAIALQPPRARPAAAQRVVETAQRPEAAAPAEFIVRFRGSGPIARAMTRAGRDPARAQREVEAQLRRQSEFAGLCFGRFTAGGAEVVLRTCGDAPAPAAVQREWLTRLRGMQAVDYADANLAASTN